MLKSEEKEEIRRRIGAQLIPLSERITEFREPVRPISPGNAISRVGRILLMPGATACVRCAR